MSIEDTIIAVSSAATEPRQTARSIVRLSGAGVWQVLEGCVSIAAKPTGNSVLPCRVRVCEGLDIAAVLYGFDAPHSYTGQDMAELHLWAAADIAAALLKTLCGQDAPYRARLARPGEFTQRAYLNGKMDLTQAEAVAQIVSSANTVQLAAAEKLLHGRFAQTLAAVRADILEVLGLLEAGLDFTEEDITFIAVEQATGRIAAQRKRLENLLDGSIQQERMIDLDAVGLAGLPNAGKSSLLNALLGSARSIVSSMEATTRDILTGVLELNTTSCVLFDCAGLGGDTSHRDPIDQQAHWTAVDALQRAAVVVFCIDAAKTDLSAERQVLWRLQKQRLIPIATKADAVEPQALTQFLEKAEPLFDTPMLVTSAHRGQGLAELKSEIEAVLFAGQAGDAYADRLTLNHRHRQRLGEAVAALTSAADELYAGRDEVAAMLLRQTYQTLGGIEHENVSEKILDSIFSRFCIGK